MPYKLRPRFQSSSNIFTDNDCQLSNDPPVDGEVRDLSLCNIQQYRCRSKDEDMDELLIAYQYEIFLKQDAVDQDLAREYLEEAMLYHLARRTGTIECDGGDSIIFSDVLGVNRAPNDTFDPRFDSCVSPPIEGTVCVPMSGGTTVFLRASNRTVDGDQKLLAAVVESIRSEMENDLYVRSGSIEKVAFVNRSVSVNDILDGNTSTPRESGLETGAKVGVATGATLFFLLLLLLVLLVTKRKRSQARVLEDPDEDEYTSGNGSLAKKDSLALKPRHANMAQTPPRKILSKDAAVATPETPESDLSLSFEESPKEKVAQSSTSPASIMARANSNRHSDSIMNFAVSKSAAAEDSGASKNRAASSSPFDIEAPRPEVSRGMPPIGGLLAPAFSKDSDTVSDFDQGCCMGFSLL